MGEREEISAAAALFAVGHLDSASSARFVARLRDGCQVAVAEYAAFAETTAAALQASLPLHTPPSALRDRLLARIAVTVAPQPPPAVVQPGPSAMVVTRAADAHWLPGPAPGVQVCLLREQKTMLVRLSPGACVPPHHHASAEQCLVMQGSLTDGEITVYAGDYVYMPAGSTHRELSSAEGCTFLIAYA